jgi:hypothetical protein
MDRMTDRGTNTLASRGLEKPFFPVVLLCCVSFWFWREMRELALHYFPADCFGIEREIVFGVTYVLSVQYSCAGVSFFVVAGKLILLEYLTVTIVSQNYRELSL